MLFGDLAIAEQKDKGILVLLEPDENVRDALSLLLQGEGWQVIVADDCVSMESALDSSKISAVISESSLPGCSAGRILECCKAHGLPVIFTGHQLALQGAVDLIREGALDYLDKPFPQGRLINLLEGLYLGQNVKH